MKVTIKYYGMMRKYGTEESYVLPFLKESCRLSDVLMEIAKSKDRSFEQIIYDPDRKISPYISLILNGRPVISDQEYVVESSIIKLVPYIAGG